MSTQNQRILPSGCSLLHSTKPRPIFSIDNNEMAKLNREPRPKLGATTISKNDKCTRWYPLLFFQTQISIVQCHFNIVGFIHHANSLNPAMVWFIPYVVSQTKLQYTLSCYKVCFMIELHYYIVHGMH